MRGKLTVLVFFVLVVGVGKAALGGAVLQYSFDGVLGNNVPSGLVDDTTTYTATIIAGSDPDSTIKYAAANPTYNPGGTSAEFYNDNWGNNAGDTFLVPDSGGIDFSSFDEFTVELFVNPASSGSGQLRRLFSEYIYAYMYLDAGNTLHAIRKWSAAGSWNDYITELTMADFPLDTWSHVAMTWDADAGGDRFKLYVDGELADSASGTSTGTVESSAGFAIGGYQHEDGSTRQYFQGRIDEFRLSDVALEATEFLGAVPTVEFETASSGAFEAVSPAELAVILSNPKVGQTYAVDYAVTGGTAVGCGVDYYSLFTPCYPDDLEVFADNWLWSGTPGQNSSDFYVDGGVDFKDFSFFGLQWYVTNGTLLFEPGQTSRTISINVTNDGLNEEDETVVVTLSNPTGVGVQLGGTTEHTYTIIDPRPHVGFETETSYGMEDVTPATVAVSLSHAWDETATVEYEVTGGTADGNGVDYTLEDGTLTFDPCDTSEYISIDVVNDPCQECFEIIKLALFSPSSNARLGEKLQHTFTIVDDEIGETFTNSIGMEFVLIAPGSFTMGSDEGDFDEEPEHTVTISQPFYMGKYEVTNAQYEQFDATHGSIDHRGFSHGANEAVIFVSWEDANAFCEWLSQLEGLPYRLATEAEWEYACRAGTTTAYNTGDTCECDKHQVNTTGPYPLSLGVGATGPNPWGLYDMHGNVEEWCYDWYGPYDSGDQIDPVGRADGEVKVSRGGSHSTPVYYLRSANRMGTVAEDKHWLIGLRVVMGELPGTEPLPAPPLQRYQTNVSQEIPPDINEGPDPNVPYFNGPRKYVFIPAELDNGPLYAAHNHVPGIVECPNGDLLIIWYSTIGERDRLLTIAASRLRHGDDTWEAASWFWDTADRNNHTPAIWLDEQSGTIYHFNGISDAYSWTPLAVILRKSSDNGVSWSRPRVIIPEHDIRHMPVESIIRTSGGSLILPCDAVPGGSGGTAIWISDDDGLTWYDPGDKMAGIHAAVAEISGNRLLGFGRSDNIDGKMPKSISSDMGESWSYSASVFSPIGSGQRCVLLRLEEGPLFFASFGGDGLFGALSYDEGETWPVQRLITDGNPCHEVETTDGEPFSMCPDNAEPKGYLSVCQAKNGVIHLISSRQHYAFNLAWVTD